MCLEYDITPVVRLCTFRFFFNDPATTEIYTLSLHDALPILTTMNADTVNTLATQALTVTLEVSMPFLLAGLDTSRVTEIGRHTSELQSHVNLVCRLLLEKKKKTTLTSMTHHNTDTTSNIVMP